LALTPQNNDAFFREVDEELRRDELLSFWQRWGRWVIVGVIAAILAFGGYLFWQNRQQVAAGEQGEQLASVFDDLAANNTAAAEPKLAELAQSDSQAMRVMARFTEADMLLARDDLKGAAAKFAEVANDSGLDQVYRDLALIRQTSAEFDTMQPQAVIGRLQGLASKENAWFGSAGELVAAAHLRMDRPDLALRVFQDIAATEDVPESIRQRAVQMASVLSATAGDAGNAAQGNSAAPAAGEEKNGE
jgi:hypothetical protein